jgi:flagellar basal body-associated protein FliL
MKFIRWLMLIVVIVVLIYGASPYFSFWRFTVAVQSRNAGAISARVDFSGCSSVAKEATGGALCQGDEHTQTLE